MPAKTKTSSAQPSSTCPAELPSNYLAPRLIQPVDKTAPDSAPGTQYNGRVSPSVSSIFTFDIPTSLQGQSCTLKFLLPTQAQLETSSFTTSGSGGVDFKALSSPAQNGVSYSSAPSVASDLGTVDVQPGNAYTVTMASCPAGQSVSYEMSSAGSYELEFFEDFNPCPIGLYIFPGN